MSCLRQKRKSQERRTRLKSSAKPHLRQQAPKKPQARGEEPRRKLTQKAPNKPQRNRKMMCFGASVRRKSKTNHCVIVLLDDTQLVHELQVSLRCESAADVFAGVEVPDPTPPRAVNCSLESQSAFRHFLRESDVCLCALVALGKFARLRKELSRITREVTAGNCDCPAFQFAAFVRSSKEAILEFACVLRRPEASRNLLRGAAQASHGKLPAHRLARQRLDCVISPKPAKLARAELAAISERRATRAAQSCACSARAERLCVCVGAN